MKHYRRIGVLILFWFCIRNIGFGQDAAVIRVHFLYGSKPAKGYRNVERKWFGGVLGGHVGIEGTPNYVLNFMKRGKRVHWFASGRRKNSRYALHSAHDFWKIFRTGDAAVKKATVVIPVSLGQRQLFDNLSTAYLRETPYDYAFFGMRCGSATYDILAQLGIVKRYSHRRTFMKIFYPKKLRKRLLKAAEKNNWEIVREDGTTTRKWERD